MKTRTSRRPKDGTFLVDVAKSIGATLGTIAAKANAAQRSLTRSSLAKSVKREGKKVARGSKRVARKARNAAGKLTQSKLAAATRRELHRATSSAKRAARKRFGKARSARRMRARS